MILLASASARRVQILSEHGVSFEAQGADIDETPRSDESPRDYVLRMASEKALAKKHCLDQFQAVLAADTCVSLDQQIFAKPECQDQFRQTMQQLSSRDHWVRSAIAWLDKQGIQTRLVETRVWFKPLSTDEIDRYWQTGEPLGKAGGYAIQGLGAELVTRIDGSYSAVVGLPIYETMQLVRSRAPQCVT